MKKTILIISALLFTYSAYATDKSVQILENKRAKETFDRLIESAHPTPAPIPNRTKWERNFPMAPPFAPNSEPSMFLNKNTIDDEKNEASKMQNESSIAVCPTKPNYVISSAVDYRAGSSAWIYQSYDGGKTWTNKNLGIPYKDWTSSNDPSVTFNADGVGFLVYGGFGPSRSENGVFFAKTTDFGATWRAHIPVIQHIGAQTLDSAFEDKYYIQSDNSPSSPHFKNLYIPWKRVSARDSATQIVIARSTNGGEVWQTPVNVSDRLPGSSEDTTFGQSFPLCTTGPNGEVYVVWNYGPKHSVGFAKSNDAGLTFTKPRIIQTYKEFGTPLMLSGQGVRHTVKGKVRAESYPSFACDITSSRKGTLYLCWAGDKIPNIYFSKSTDKGETWSSPKIIHSDTTNDQFWPWLAIDPKNGDVAIMYFDSRRDPKNLMVECFVSYSSDGGETWLDKPAADVSSDLRNNPFTGSAFAGDYSGCAFYDGMIMPTWVDMRYAVKDLYDSDVFTALVNTRVPQPIRDFKITINPEKIQTLQLNWTNTNKRAFEQPLAEKDYTILIYRDDVFYKSLPGGSNQLEDIGLEAYRKYTYSIKIATDKDTSIAVSAVSYPGGAKAPMAPRHISYAGSADFSVKFNILAPTFRADSVTKLINFKKINVYRAHKLISSFDFTPADTGKTLQVTDKLPQKQFAVYNFTVSDAAGNESAACDSVVVYSGEIKYADNFTESFDTALPSYYVKGTWAITGEFAFSAPNSLTESPNAKYNVNKNDYIIFYPFKTNGEKFQIQFYQAALVEPKDTCYIEYSTNYGQTWTNKFDDNKVGLYNRNLYPEWTDGALDAKDWKKETLVIPETQEPVFVRARIFSGPLTTDIGWFIDDLTIKPFVSAVEETNANKSQIKIYPNPAKDFIKLFIENSQANYEYEIYSLPGGIVSKGQLDCKSGEALINIHDLLSGAYYLVIKNDNSTIVTTKLNIIK